MRAVVGAIYGRPENPRWKTLFSTIQISPLVPTAIMSTRRPLGEDTSAKLDWPADRNSSRAFVAMEGGRSPTGIATNARRSNTNEGSKITTCVR